VPAKLKYKKAKSLVDKESRFLFSNKPDVKITVLKADGKPDKDSATVLQNFVDNVLKTNLFSNKLLQAAKDCFIGRRVACMLNFNEETGIKVSFVKSLEFYYETDDNDADVLTKIVAFVRIHDSTNSADVRIFKKKYYMQDGYCRVEEIVYDGSGKALETVTPDQATLFTYIPAIVIVNDGLTGDLKGESEIETLAEYESWYSKLANADKDAERKSMNPTKYAIDCDPASTAGLSTAAGSFWDLTSDENASEEKQGKVGVLEPVMAYREALKITLDRINTMMYEQVDVPNVSAEALKGVVSSGKTLKAIYWGLIVRCDEKMLVWGPALEFAVSTIIEGAKLYPKSAISYTVAKIQEVIYDVTVENNYPIPEDEAEEKTVDMAEVTGQAMSRKAYMKKWRQLTDEEADDELQQIATEAEMFASSFGNLPPTDNSLTEDNSDKEGKKDTGVDE
jgi:hypothetical protein